MDKQDLMEVVRNHGERLDRLEDEVKDLIEGLTEIPELKVIRGGKHPKKF
jgi:hypothetical protein